MKHLKTFIYLLGIPSLLLMNGCTTGGDDDNIAPGIFSTNTVDTRVDGATIQWTESVDPDGDSVTYAIILEGTEIASGSSTLTYSFSGLEPETLYQGYVEARDGNGGKSRADFFFTTEPEVIILEIIVEEFLRETTANCTGVDTALEIAAGVLVPKQEGNVTYNLSFSTLTLNNGNSTIAAASRTWTNSNFNSYYIYDYDANNYFVWQARGGFSCSNSPDIPDTRIFYSTADCEATVTITHD